MSENSLEIRNKFINKINNKIKDLNENITLLAKVDNKIFKNSQYGGNINRQTGGDDSEKMNKAIMEMRRKSKVQPDLQKIEKHLDDIKIKFTMLYSTIDDLNKRFINTTTKEQLANMMKNFEEVSSNTTKTLSMNDLDIIELLQVEYKKNPNDPKYKEDYEKMINQFIAEGIKSGTIEQPAENLHLRYKEEIFKKDIQEIDDELNKMAPKAVTPLPPTPPPGSTNLAGLPPPGLPPPGSNPGGTKYLRGFF
jgi:hypothetical protein